LHTREERMTVHFNRPPRGWMPPAGKTLVCTELDFLPPFAAADYLFLAAKTLENNRRSGPPYRELTRRASRRLPELKKLVTWSIEYPVSGMEKWIDARVEGPGRRGRYFPIGRVLPEEVAKYLYANLPPLHKAVWRLEDMRRRGEGPGWLKLGRRVTYYMPDVLEWAKQLGTHSAYVMRPVIADVIVKEPSEYHKLVDRISALVDQGVPHAQAIDEEINREAECRARGGHKG
jgi:hypothetical protein